MHTREQNEQARKRCVDSLIPEDCSFLRLSSEIPKTTVKAKEPVYCYKYGGMIIKLQGQYMYIRRYETDLISPSTRSFSTDE